MFASNEAGFPTCAKFLYDSIFSFHTGSHSLTDVCCIENLQERRQWPWVCMRSCQTRTSVQRFHAAACVDIIFAVNALDQVTSAPVVFPGSAARGGFNYTGSFPFANESISDAALNNLTQAVAAADNDVINSTYSCARTCACACECHMSADTFCSCHVVTNAVAFSVLAAGDFEVHAAQCICQHQHSGRPERVQSSSRAK